MQLGAGRTLGVERFGDPEGEPVICCHGLPGSRLDLVHQAPLFASRGLAAIALDRPGFGRSTRRAERTLLEWAEDVRALADRWGLERFAVLGYSSGGRYALACAAALPERLTTVSLLASPGPPEMPGFRHNLTRLDRASLALAGRAPAAAAALWSPIRWLALHRPERLAAALGRSLSPPDRAYLGDSGRRAAFLASLAEGLRQGVGAVIDEYAIEARPWGFELERIEAPVRLWHGDRDRVVGLPHSIYLAGRIPGARLEVLRGAGHFLHLEVERIAGAIAQRA